MEHIFYLANVLGALSTLFKVFMVLGLCFALFLICGAVIEGHNYGKDDEGAVLLKKLAIRCGIIFIVSGLGYIFVPDKDTYLLMKGGEIVEEAYKNSSDLQELPGNTAEFLNEYVKTLTKELKEANKE